MHVLQVEPQLLETYVADGRVRLAFWHVIDHGAASQLTHHAAECAGQQTPLGFWQMHHLLFERQGQLWSATPESMAAFAQELALDAPAFSACLDDPTIGEKVARMDQERRERGIRSRPSFDLNGELIRGAAPYATFSQVLDSLLAGQ